MNLHIYAMHAGVIEKPFFSLEEKFLWEHLKYTFLQKTTNFQLHDMS